MGRKFKVKAPKPKGAKKAVIKKVTKSNKLKNKKRNKGKTLA